ncbi:MAG: FHA domain-containing protein [Nitrospirae bacterium]|uniref:FHA domain-containing protein n=1 Tax=Candidatus Magnetobacterium casense TaxID=1455061 RepID=UPI00069691DE|nr:FHA domain-containing protein [Candidatus Magnetobacterium casensis]MBF0338050.1 FHA domain-containing protein [Nitrospirota bacterium]
MVKLVKCTNGHFYDKSKTPSCPDCELIKGVLEPTASVFGIGETSVSGSHDPLHVEEANERPAQQWLTFNPTTGWLIVIEGDSRGQDYCLKIGKNEVGRSKENHISIETDRLMSRKHALLFYYPKLNSFFIENLSPQGTKLNGQPITEKTRLKDLDVIEMGSTMFLLRTLCDEDFTWKDFGEDTTGIQQPKNL